MHIVLVLVIIFSLSYTFVSFGVWLGELFNRKFLYIYDPDTKLRKIIYILKQICEFILILVGAILIFPRRNNSEFFVYIYTIAISIIYGLFMEKDRKSKF